MTIPIKNCICSLLFVLGSIFISSAQFTNTSANVYLANTYSEKEVTLDYSAVVALNQETTADNKIVLDLTLDSFFIENATYKDELYRDHDVYGISFPVNTAIKMNAKVQILYDTKFINKVIVLKYNEASPITIENQIAIPTENIKVKITNTYRIEKLYDNEIFIDEIKEQINVDKSLLTDEQLNEEYTRLMILGNDYLNRNNYLLASEAYRNAKKYTTNAEKVDTQLSTTEKYALENEVNLPNQQLASSKIYQPIQRKKTTTSARSSKEAGEITKSVTKVSKAVASTKVPSKPVQPKVVAKPDFETKVVDGVEYEYEDSVNVPTQIVETEEVETEDVETEEVEYETTDGIEYEYETDAPVVASLDDESEYEYEYEDASKNYTEKANATTNIEYEDTETGETSIPQAITEEIQVVENTLETPSVKAVSKTSTSRPAPVRKMPARGIIKYKRDQQAVVDTKGKVLIPYGEYTILHYNSGFARIKLKDPIPVKNIVCTGENDEYVWSARIYENPWVETVIDNGGNYVDDLVKKVEIYMVDNVNYKPIEDMPESLRASYKDPNPFRGTQQISAFNLWNRDHDKDPEVVARRREIEGLKQVSRAEANAGASSCGSKISPKFQSVVDYYRDLGYKIYLKK